MVQLHWFSYNTTHFIFQWFFCSNFILFVHVHILKFHHALHFSDSDGRITGSDAPKFFATSNLCYWRSMRGDCGVYRTHWVGFSEEMLPLKTLSEGAQFGGLGFQCFATLCEPFQDRFYGVFLSFVCHC